MKGTPITEELHAYIVETFAPEDDLLKRLPAEAEAKGIPQIHISPEQGKFLQVLMGAAGAKKVLEVGSLFGYSTIWMARALPPDGKLITIELDPLHAQTTRENVARAGLADRVEVREGDARAILPQLAGEAPFDLAFIDAEKAEYLDYMDAALRLVRKGGLIIGDNASARGLVWRTDLPEEERGFALPIRAFNQRMASDSRLLSLLVPIADGMCVGVVR
ncbi:MAG: O-methyltransferase [Anaerolineae bacterium]|jgi:caffeoyl-CoA O-methyltransferase|nr:O-methyltransferase [Anaerolineae bacterium]